MDLARFVTDLALFATRFVAAGAFFRRVALFRRGAADFRVREAARFAFAGLRRLALFLAEVRFLVAAPFLAAELFLAAVLFRVAAPFLAAALFFVVAFFAEPRRRARDFVAAFFFPPLLFLPLLEPARDDFLAAAMFQAPI